ncbi:DUF1800 domain-containing protein [Dinghuibacter silviterrae]|uniref:Uncharacterized protein (DUF1800 family) n=1 Tax=Dinghuibacter silviterrae TaxID=1539049 RepID=A0A4R8DWQ3_9BACT|nr:DUF1800 family protein [Dinghuibacter silviterrae]TDX01945.1 uncharacterized protein (DUF1800 family) [Dinghuibacter silviterrae]
MRDHSAMRAWPGSTSGIQEYTGTWGTAQVVHLLKRTLFGATVADVNYFSGLSMSQAVDEILTPTAAPTSQPLNNYGTDVTGVAPYTTWIGTGLTYQDQNLNASRVASMQCWWMGQMLGSGRSIHEKITLFWHNHFAMDATQHFMDIPAQLWYNQYLTLRANALGSFAAMVKAITLDPAMLIFLNGSTNVNTSPNENYGRELQELYTEGKGTNSLYTQTDVHNAARVLTGHTVDAGFNYVFQAGNHDDQDKQFSPYYSNHVVTGYSGTVGAGELDDMLGMLLGTDESAKFICRKLYNFFIYYVDDATVEANVIVPLASVFRSSGYNITTVLSTLFKSQHFYDLVYAGACLIKSPLDFLVGLVREFNLALPAASNPQGQYSAWTLLLNQATILQQEVLAIPVVAGWYAYYESPTYHELWINSVTYPQRNYYTDLLMTSGDMMSGTTLVVDPVAFTATLSNPSDPVQLVSDALSILLTVPVSANDQELMMRTILLTNQTNNAYWTQAWQAYTANPSDMNAYSTVFNRLQAFYKYVMDLPEYHLS